MQWHGPYPVVRRLGPVNYEVDMYDKRKRQRIFHINMLRKWHTPSTASLLAEDLSAEAKDEIVLWKDNETKEEQPIISDRLLECQQTQLHTLLEEYKDVLSNEPERTTMAEHNIETKSGNPVRQSNPHFSLIKMCVVQRGNSIKVPAESRDWKVTGSGNSYTLFFANETLDC